MVPLKELKRRPVDPRSSGVHLLEADVGEGGRGRDAGLGAHQGLRVLVVLDQPTVEGVLGRRSVPHARQERVNGGRLRAAV